MKGRVASIIARCLKRSVVLVVGLLLATVILVLPWRWIAPPSTAFMARERAAGRDVAYQWVAWEEISPHLPIAAVAAEDQAFPLHRGFDIDSIRSAMEERRRRRRGASTISQQVAKNLFLWPGRSWIRKGLEAYFTLLIEALWPKRRILEVYLNIAEFGPGVYGAGAAAHEFFGTTAARLTARQSALLAAVLPSPRRMSAGAPSAYVERRVEWILRQVEQLGGPSFLQDL